MMKNLSKNHTPFLHNKGHTSHTHTHTLTSGCMSSSPTDAVKCQRSINTHSLTHTLTHSHPHTHPLTKCLHRAVAIMHDLERGHERCCKHIKHTHTLLTRYTRHYKVRVQRQCTISTYKVLILWLNSRVSFKPFLDLRHSVCKDVRVCGMCVWCVSLGGIRDSVTIDLSGSRTHQLHNLHTSYTPHITQKFIATIWSK